MQKDVYLNEQIVSQKKFEETKLLPKNEFYSKLTMKVISDQPWT